MDKGYYLKREPSTNRLQALSQSTIKMDKGYYRLTTYIP